MSDYQRVETPDFKPNLQPAALIPVYHWRGARPWLLDFDEDQTGWITCLCLQREGECCLFPIAWERGAMPTDILPALKMPYPTINSEALDEMTTTFILNEMEGDGWKIAGRLDFHFNGRESSPRFLADIKAFLWQKPGERDGNKDGNTLPD